ncbi:MAG: OmpA family protein [Succinivibrionaceae bacterium]|nr:OmpA family protein [Succinivibrionaceae bacterium]
MAKKPKIPEHENMERWMVSYADLLTLLFALFVILYGFAMSNQTEVKSVIQGLIQSFSEMGFVTARPGSSVLVGNMGVDGSNSSANLSSSPAKDIPIVSAPVEGGGGVLDFGASTNFNNSNSPDTSAGDNEKQNSANGLSRESRSESEILAQDLSESVTGAPLDSLQQEIEEGLQELIQEKIIVITRHEYWLTIDLDSALLFPQGSATILNRLKPVLDQLASVLASVNNYIHIRGYTDDRYIGDELYHSNWELSAARAISVLNYFEAKEIDPRRMAIEAYGKYSPFASNSTKRGREQNRKVVVAISKYAFTPRKLPIVEDEPEQTGDDGRGASPEVKADDFEIIRLPDGRMQLKRREK